MEERFRRVSDSLQAFELAVSRSNLPFIVLKQAIEWGHMGDLGQQLICILESSQFLQGILPPVRIYALRETLRFADDDKAVDVLLENVSTSPHIPHDKKEPLANLVLERDWDRLKNALACNDGRSHTANAESDHDAFISFRQMVATVFSTSRRLHGIPESIKRRLGASIYQCDSIDTLKELCISSLLSSTAFVDHQRDSVANAVMDDRYDLLIVTDLFDCEVGARRAAVANGVRSRVNSAVGLVSNVFRRRGSGAAADDYSDGRVSAPTEKVEEEECAICLGHRISDCALPACNHRFCKDCLRDWVAQDATCPLCREPIDRATLAL